MKTRIFKIVPAQSRIEWIGRKVTGSHDGTIDIKNGEIILHDGSFVGGSLVVDTTSIRVLDITDPVTNDQMVGHLVSADFFAAQNFPEARLNIISVNDNQVDATLTIKGITHRISFEAAIESTDTFLTASAQLVIDRTDYDMKFRSGKFFQNLGDTLIYNDFELIVTLAARAA